MFCFLSFYPSLTNLENINKYYSIMTKEVLSKFFILGLGVFLFSGCAGTSLVSENQVPESLVENKATASSSQTGKRVESPVIDRKNIPTEEVLIKQSESITDNSLGMATSSESLVDTYYKVLKVVDGDTFSLDINGKAEIVRIIGADTPELKDPRKPVQCFAAEASAKASEWLEGRRVKIAKDPTQGERDKYDRLLLYLWRDDGFFYNQEIIKQGYAHEYTYNIPYKYQNDFKEAQKYASENKLGLWADNACPVAIETSVSKNSAPVISSAVANPIVVPEKSIAVTASASEKYNCSSNTYNCGDFKSQPEAQAVYQYCGGAANDIHRLDGSDKDGVVCESLPKIK